MARLSSLGLGALSADAFALMGGAIQNGNVALGNASGTNGVTVSTLAGSAGVAGTTDGTGAARFNHPASVAIDGTLLHHTSGRSQSVACKRCRGGNKPHRCFLRRGILAGEIAG